MAIKKVGVVGCGLMGHGISQVAAQAGYEVTVRELSQEKLDSGLGKNQRQLTRAVEKGGIDQASVTTRPEHFLGLHFFNPAQVMPLLEVVQSISTSTGTLEEGFEFGRSLKKTVVHARDKAGFIVNRLLIPFLLDAIRAYEEGFGSIEQIDAAMKAGANHPMGPFELLDFVGLDTTKSVGEIMFDEFRERRFRAPPTLRKLVTAGHLGRKTGRGFYDYSGDKPLPIDHEHAED